MPINHPKIYTKHETVVNEIWRCLKRERERDSQKGLVIRRKNSLHVYPRLKPCLSVGISEMPFRTCAKLLLLILAVVVVLFALCSL